MKHTANLLISLMFVVMGILTACQPTPEQEVVTNKLDGALEQAVRAEPVGEYQYEVPETWKEDFPVKEQMVFFDATIEIMEAKKYPVLTIQRDSFHASKSFDIMSAVYGQPVEMREQQHSYDEVLIDLQNAQRGWVVGRDEETNEPIWGPYEGQDEEIAALKSLLAELSPIDSFVSLETSMLEPPVADRVIRFADGSQAYFSSNQTNIQLRRHRSCNIQLENWVMQGDATPGEEAHALENINISEKDAVAIGDRIIAALGRNSDMLLASAQKARATESYSYRVHGEGYLLTYVSCGSGCIPFCYEKYSNHPAFYFENDDEAYAERWRQEHIEIFVTEDGVLTFSWAAPKQVVNTANENTSLLPFEDVQQRIRELIALGINGGREKDNFEVSRIVLGATIQQIPNQGEEAFLVPTWIITLTTTGEREMNIDPSILMINAIDGSYISR